MLKYVSFLYQILLALLIIVVISPLSIAEDWVTYRHDNHRSGVTSESLNVKTLSEAWTWRSSAPPQRAWPGPAKWDAYIHLRGLSDMRDYDAAFEVIAVGDAIYFGSSVDDAVRCLDKKTGKLRWLFHADGPIRIAPAYSKGALYFGSDDGRAYAISAKDGQSIWSYQPAVKEPTVVNNGWLISRYPCRSGVMIEGKTAYTTFSLLPWKPSYLCALDIKTGKPQGEGHYVHTVNGKTFEGAMLTTKQWLITPQGRVAPALFQRENHREGRSLAGGGGSFVTVLSENELVHGPGNKTGWVTINKFLKPNKKEKPKMVKGKNSALFTEEAAYYLGKQQLVKISQKTNQQVWQKSLSSATTIILAGDILFVGERDRVIAIDSQQGKEIWSADVDGIAHGLVVANGSLLVSTDNGVIHCFQSGIKTVSQTTPKKRVKKTLPNLTRLPRKSRTKKDRTQSGQWTFESGMFERAKRFGVKQPQQHVQNLAGGKAGTILGTVQIRRVGGVEALELDGQSTSVMIAKDFKEANLPIKAITAEAWVRLDQTLSWGGIIGAIQDNGIFERGWLLGYKGNKFYFAVNGTGGTDRLTYLTATDDFKLGQWYHVAGTYDGKTMRIFVNGKLANSSNAQQGEIKYPPDAFFEIGSYHDKDEQFRMTGLLHEVSLFHRTLSSREIAKRYAAKQKLFPIPTKLALGPYASFISVDSAIIQWQTEIATATLLQYELDNVVELIEDKKPKREHSVTLKKLKRNRIYQYSIVTSTKKGRGETSKFELDTHFNYSIPVAEEKTNTYPKDKMTVHYQAAAKEILSHSKSDKGICLVIGCHEGRLMWELALQSNMRIIGLDIDPKKIISARKHLMKTGFYGRRVTVRQVDSYDHLPFGSKFASLITTETSVTDAKISGVVKEWKRLLRPSGGVIVTGQIATSPLKYDQKILTNWLKNDGVEQDNFKISIHGTNGLWGSVTRNPLKGTGEWSHLYGKADNAAYGGESLGDVKSATDLEVQWFGKPGPRVQPDRSGRKPSPLAINGRLFVQGMQKLMALDAYNGTILWSIEIPELERFNMPRDCGNWCADNNFVYVAVRDRCWQIDAQTGEIVRFRNVLPSQKNQKYDWSYIARAGKVLLGSAVKQGTGYTNFWGNADVGWYDSRSGPATFKVCSDYLFAEEIDSNKRLWTIKDGLIINPTITATDKHIYYVTCRNPKVMKSASRRIETPELWKNQFLVCRNSMTGKKEWEEPLKVIPGTVVIYMAHSQNKLLIASSANKQANLYAYDDKNGKQLWQSNSKWVKPKGDHGRSVSRPAIVGNKVFLRPSVFDLNTGYELPEKMPDGGCGTYAATKQFILFRKGNVALWNSDDKKLSQWSRLRPGCWLSTIPACGLVLSPEAGGGCSCGSWLETSLGFMPR